jgi:hypothetical protein
MANPGATSGARLSVALWLVLLGGCTRSGDPGDGRPGAAADGASYGPTDYVSDCVAELGYIPSFDCYQDDEAVQSAELVLTVTVPDLVDDVGEPIVTTVRSQADLENGLCDNPFFLGMGGNQCVPFSRVGYLTGHDNRGFETQFAFICRAYRFRTPDANGQIRFDDIGYIGHNPRTGATCFWFAPIYGGADGAYGPSIPSPAEQPNFWHSPQELPGGKCFHCHDNDPFIQTPTVRATGVLPDRSYQELREGRYWAVAADRLNSFAGGVQWSGTRHLDAGVCSSCHRISNGFTCQTLALDAAGLHKTAGTATTYTNFYPFNTWMNEPEPAVLVHAYPTREDWLAQFGPSVDTISRCCANPNAPGCLWRDIPGPPPPDSE